MTELALVIKCLATFWWLFMIWAFGAERFKEASVASKVWVTGGSLLTFVGLWI